MKKIKNFYLPILFLVLGMCFVSCDNSGDEPQDPMADVQNGGVNAGNTAQAGSGATSGNSGNSNSGTSNTPVTGTENGYAWVDLGLSVKWATCNVGATAPEKGGDKFQWGAVTTTGSYTTEDPYVLPLEMDAAAVNMGGKWRMPTDAELTELREQCTWTWTTENGIKGYKVTSRINGKSIFLPAAGNRTGPLLGSVGDGYYWSSSISTEGSPVGAYYLYFLSGSVNRYDGSRDYGQSVRPVCP
jgi:hypothetical protein